MEDELGIDDDKMEEDFAAAIEECEAKEPTHEDAPPEQVLPKAEEFADGSLPRETDTGEAADATETGKDTTTDNTSKEEAAEDKTPQAVDEEKLKPPVGWKAEAREKWGELPDEAKKQIGEREREIATLMQETSHERKTARHFAETLMPYRQALEQLGYTDPFSAVKDVMNTAVKLRTGTSTQRAAATAELIKNFGIDINELDSALSGSPVSNGSDTAQFQQMLEEKLAPMQQFMSQVTGQQNSQQQQVASQAQNDVAAFTQQAEFVQDVRLEMADLMEMASKRGQSMSLQDAYDRACQINPSVQAVMKSREVAAAQPSAADIARKRAAASSITGRQAGSAQIKNAETIEDALREAIDFHSGS